MWSPIPSPLASPTGFTGTGTPSPTPAPGPTLVSMTITPSVDPAYPATLSYDNNNTTEYIPTSAVGTGVRSGTIRFTFSSAIDFRYWALLTHPSSAVRNPDKGWLRGSSDGGASWDVLKWGGGTASSPTNATLPGALGAYPAANNTVVETDFGAGSARTTWELNLDTPFGNGLSIFEQQVRLTSGGPDILP